jgi:hypothetical protein
VIKSDLLQCWLYAPARQLRRNGAIGNENGVPKNEIEHAALLSHLAG